MNGIIGLLLCFSLAGSPSAETADAGGAAHKTSTPAFFTDNLDEAMSEAKTSGKALFVCFSGSDWCGWCQKLESEVLSQEEFVSPAKEKFVLVFIDSPSDTSLLSEWAKKHNAGLVKKYGIRGFPTALVMDADGNKVAKTGYRRGGAAAYAKHLEALLKNAPQIKDLKKQVEELEKRIEKLEAGE